MLWFDKAKLNELYHIKNDASEKNNLMNVETEVAASLRGELMAWLDSARKSYEYGDYPGYTKQGNFIKTEP